MAKEMACDYIIPMDNEITPGVVVVVVTQKLQWTFAMQQFQRLRHYLLLCISKSGII
jgi:hypothetical protein